MKKNSGGKVILHENFGIICFFSVSVIKSELYKSGLTWQTFSAIIMLSKYWFSKGASFQERGAFLFYGTGKSKEVT
ncbi:hypothetical protein [uncultured Ruminococcus sp.]|uniref:hypothetical protein n=1 Tax=uncultured Ruminococcus sp. TaxID=165186 RepID=UPI0026177877|nr:hypothetical protein [uncultured Ruminococcus sp.]